MPYAYVPTEDALELIDDVSTDEDSTAKPRTCSKIRHTRNLLLCGTCSLLLGLVILLIVAVAYHGSNVNQDSADHEQDECGRSLLVASTKICGMFLENFENRNDSERCLTFEAFLNCTAIYLSTQGVNWKQCGFSSLYQNLMKMNNSVITNSSRVCESDHGPPTFDHLEQGFLGTTLNFCINKDIYSMFLQYLCPPDPDVFAGHSEKDQCLSSISRTLCLKKAFHEGGTNCTDEIIVQVSSVVLGHIIIRERREISVCERDYECVLEELRHVEGDTELASCVSGVNSFLMLSTLGLPINNMTGFGGDSQKLKCRVWSVLSACALHEVSLDCQQHVDQVQSGLQMLANLKSTNSEELVAKVNIFDECPGFSRSLSGCPVDEELVYSTIAYCSHKAMKLYQEHGSSDKLCQFLKHCEESIKAGYSSCPDIDVYFDSLQKNGTQQAYLRQLLAFDCG